MPDSWIPVDTVGPGTAPTQGLITGTFSAGDVTFTIVSTYLPPNALAILVIIDGLALEPNVDYSYDPLSGLVTFSVPAASDGYYIAASYALPAPFDTSLFLTSANLQSLSGWLSSVALPTDPDVLQAFLDKLAIGDDGGRIEADHLTDDAAKLYAMAVKIGATPTLNTIADLKALPLDESTPAIFNIKGAFANSSYAFQVFRDPNDTTTLNNDFTHFVGPAGYRWRPLVNGPLDLRIGGAFFNYYEEDGTTINEDPQDDQAYLQGAMAAFAAIGGGACHWPDKTAYMVMVVGPSGFSAPNEYGINIPSNTSIHCTKNSAVFVAGSSAKGYRAIISVDTADCYLGPLTVYGERSRHLVANDGFMFGMNVALLGVSRWTVDRLTSIEANCDGLYFGTWSHNVCTDVIVNSPRLLRNLRCGGTIVSGQNISVYDSYAEDTGITIGSQVGTVGDPWAGWDLELDNSTERLSGIRFYNPRSKNNLGYGINISIPDTTTPVDVVMYGGRSIGDNIGFGVTCNTATVTGAIKFEQGYAENSGLMGIKVSNKGDSSLQVIFDEPYILNPNSSGNGSPRYGSGISFYQESGGSADGISNFHLIRPTVIDNRATHLMYAGICCDDQTASKINKVNIVDPIKISGYTDQALFMRNARSGVTVSDIYSQLVFKVPDTTHQILSTRYWKTFSNENFTAARVVNLPQITSNSSGQGSWNASTNSPTLANGSGTAGYFYTVSTAGTQNLGAGSDTYAVGDVLLYENGAWTHIVLSTAKPICTPLTFEINAAFAMKITPLTGVIILGTDSAGAAASATGKYIGDTNRRGSRVSLVPLTPAHWRITDMTGPWVFQA